jgi:hypothetical protein
LIISKGLFGANRGNDEHGFIRANPTISSCHSVIPKIAEAIQDDNLIEATQGFASVEREQRQAK